MKQICEILFLCLHIYSSECLCSSGEDIRRPLSHIIPLTFLPLNPELNHSVSVEVV